MKKANKMVPVLLICLIVFGALSLLSAALDGGKTESAEAVARAEDYVKRELYQLAIIEYKKAIALHDSEELRDAVLDAYEKWYEESEDIIEDYILAAESAAAAFSEKEKYHIILAKAHMRNEQYQNAYRALQDATEQGLDTDKLRRMYIEAKYSFSTRWYEYTEIKHCVDGFYPVKDSELWGYVDEEGSSETGFLYAFVSPYGEEGIRILSDTEDAKSVLMDADEILRGRLPFVPADAGVFADGLFPISNGVSYSYYDSLGDKKFGNYELAGRFQNGVAAVKENGVWKLIDTSGALVAETTYQEIRLNCDNGYMLEDIMLAKTNGKYRMYNEDLEVIGDFMCDDVDVMTEDGVIAYKEGEKWGYVDTSGEVVIAPIFEEAKSFSNGIAAVRKGGRWGFIDMSGQQVIDCQFFGADYFNEEMNCMVKTAPEIWQMIELRVDF